MLVAWIATWCFFYFRLHFEETSARRDDVVYGDVVITYGVYYFWGLLYFLRRALVGLNADFNAKGLGNKLVQV